MSFVTMTLVACGDDALPRASENDPGFEGPDGGDSSTDFGLRVGDPVPPHLAWLGYQPGSNEITTIRITDYHDPTGEKGIRALVITEGSPSCGPCVQEAADLNQRLSGPWVIDRVAVLQLMVDDGQDGPPSNTSVQNWRTFVKASWAVGLDPSFTFARGGSNPFPVQLVIDPRTLTVFARYDGYQSSLPKVDELVAKNK